MNIFNQIIKLLLLSTVLISPIFAAVNSEKTTGRISLTENKNDTYPIIIEHKYGQTEILRKPLRVVSVGYTDQDVLLALGIIPIAIRDWYGNQPSATWPWAQDELGDAKPVVLSSSELDIEQVASLNPDIIIGISSGISIDEYNLLSKIAPTITQPGEYKNYGTPWQATVKILGRIFNLNNEADKITTDIEDKITQIKVDNPSFIGKSAAVAVVFQNMPGAYASQDSRSRLIEQIGFVIPKEYDEIAGNSFYISFSEERLDLLDTDVILWLSSSEEGREELRNLPLRHNLKRFKEDRELILASVLAGAFSFSSPLSIPYLLDELVPGLIAAVDGNPETLIPGNLR